MFGGSFGSIDFNSTFAQLTSSLTLDALQERKEPDQDVQSHKIEDTDIYNNNAEITTLSVQNSDSTHHVSDGNSGIRFEQHLQELTRMKEYSKEQQSKYQIRIKELEIMNSDKEMEIKELRRIVRQYEGRVLEAEDDKEVLSQDLQRSIEDNKKLEIALDNLRIQFTLLEIEQKKLEEKLIQSTVQSEADRPRVTEGAVEPTTPLTKSTNSSQLTEDRGSEPSTPYLVPGNTEDEVLGTTADIAQSIPKKSNCDELEKKLKKYQKRIKDLDAEIKRLNEARDEREMRSRDALAAKELENTRNNETILTLTAQIASMESELEALKSSAQTDRVKLMSDMQKVREQNILEREDMVSKYESQVVALESELSRCHIQMQSLTENRSCEEEKVIKTLQQQINCLEDELKNISTQLHSQESNFTKVKGERDTLIENLNALQVGYDQVKMEIEKKSEALKDSDTKIANLTEKLKDLFQRFADLKSKNSQLESQIEQMKVEEERQLNAKESEVIKARLKLERVEQQLDDTKIKCSELSEKYGDTQRQLAELRAIHQSLVDEHVECGDLKVRVKQLEDDNEMLTKERELVLKKVTDQYQSKLSNTEQQLSELNATYQILLEQSKHNIDSGEVLEDYKKRAQLAIKKANASVVKLTEDNEKLTASLASLNQMVEEKQLEADALNLEKKDLLDELLNLRETLERNQIDHSCLVESLREKIMLLESDISQKELVLSQELCRNKEVSGSLLSQPFRLDNLLGEDGGNIHSVEGMHQSTPSPKPISLPIVHEETEPPEKYVLVSPMSDGSLVSKNDEISNGIENNVAVNGSNSLAPQVIRAGSNSNFMLVNELQQQLMDLKRDLAKRGIELESMNHQLVSEKEEKAKISARCDELIAYLARLKKSHDGDPNAAVNLEYLKNCVFKYMSTNETSERRRLFRVIGTILNFTAKELKEIEDCLNEAEQASTQVNQALSTIGSSLEGWFGAKW